MIETTNMAGILPSENVPVNQAQGPLLDATGTANMKSQVEANQKKSLASAMDKAAGDTKQEYEAGKWEDYPESVQKALQAWWQNGPLKTNPLLGPLDSKNWEKVKQDPAGYADAQKYVAQQGTKTTEASDPAAKVTANISAWLKNPQTRPFFVQSFQTLFPGFKDADSAINALEQGDPAMISFVQDNFDKIRSGALGLAQQKATEPQKPAQSTTGYFYRDNFGGVSYFDPNNREASVGVTGSTSNRPQPGQDQKSLMDEFFKTRNPQTLAQMTMDDGTFKPAIRQSMANAYKAIVPGGDAGRFGDMSKPITIGDFLAPSPVTAGLPPPTPAEQQKITTMPRPVAPVQPPVPTQSTPQAVPPVAPAITKEQQAANAQHKVREAQARQAEIARRSGLTTAQPATPAAPAMPPMSNAQRVTQDINTQFERNKAEVARRQAEEFNKAKAKAMESVKTQGLPKPEPTTTAGTATGMAPSELNNLPPTVRNAYTKPKL